MGQYFLIVNSSKKQFLYPHKFGAGLKLMEFTNTPFGPQQALCILLSNGNGRGGGDLGTEKLTAEEKALIGSWAGDPVVVAGDYGDPWKFVPEDLVGKKYKANKDHCGEEGVFGMRKNRETGKLEACDETLYSAACCFFEDISDRMITIIAKGEGGYHPYAALDLADDGWRHFPEWGRKPEKTPKQPAGGQALLKAYMKNAIGDEDAVLGQVEYLLRDHPEAAEKVLAKVTEKVVEARVAAERKRVEGARAAGRETPSGQGAGPW